MERTNYLWQQFMDKKATDQELDELFALMTDPEKETWHQAFLVQLANNTQALQNYDRSKWQYLADNVLRSASDLETVIPAVHRVHFLRTAFFRYAAIILLIAGAITYNYLARRPQETVAQLPKTTIKEIRPGGNKATLTLADGTVIMLDSAVNGTLATQGGSQVIKLGNGLLAYDQRNATGVRYAPVYNTMTTPRGGQYQLTLPDGTRVWLNASSSITYPTSFEGGERKVSITGEAYFEVESAPAVSPLSSTVHFRPVFKVEVNNMEVQVLGTHFNINAYSNEAAIRTTLLEGSVKVRREAQEILLLPGQQAALNSKGQLKGVGKVDLEATVAWKNGIFDFQDKKLDEVMRQLSRWYNIEVHYEGRVPDIEFVGGMGRDLSFDEVLRFLQKSKVHFRTEGENRLVIMP